MKNCSGKVHFYCLHLCPCIPDLILESRHSQVAREIMQKIQEMQRKSSPEMPNDEFLELRTLEKKPDW